ncbi:MAG: Flap endonuclease 1 [Candidatus Thermoplasmatota archaeon]|nr:Flap endonuclease 1 [Candidatus Thermoplasmatota archaeon]
MGVDISDLVSGSQVTIEDLSGRSVAIDAFNTLYQFLASIRQPDGTPLMDRDGRVTSHLSGLLYRTASLLEAGIRPAYVFDGEPPELKRKTIEARKAVRQEAEAEWKKARAEGDMKRALSMASRSSRLGHDMVQESKALLDALGVPWLVAPGEGEAQMARMVSEGRVWAGASQDYDALLFGTTTLVRNLTLAGKRKLPSGKTQEVIPEIVSLGEVLSRLGLTREQLVDVAVLIGTDFNDGVRGIGPKRALAAIKRAGSLEGLASEGKVTVPEEYADVRRIFLEPGTVSDYTLVWGRADGDRVRRIMCDEHGFSVDRVDAVLARLDRDKGEAEQFRLDKWS